LWLQAIAQLRKAHAAAEPALEAKVLEK
jgi:hypothetical protein